MSEKDVRDTLRVLYEEFYVKEVGFDDHTASAVYDALADPPDVVKVLRYIGNEPLRLFSAGLLTEYLEETFHIRLTDDDWKWTDE